MAYFDSPKNRAMWNLRLDTLRDAREARSSGLDGHGDGKQSAAAEREKTTPQRVHVSYNQLVMEERNARQQKRELRTEPVRSVEHEHEHEHSMAGPKR